MEIPFEHVSCLPQRKGWMELGGWGEIRGSDFFFFSLHTPLSCQRHEHLYGSSLMAVLYPV